ncbi:MAG: hypothetical protein UT63_C0075G0001, partial [Candidatus Gottesmanbacteria bacterium GW2011_GWC2_39_8]
MKNEKSEDRLTQVNGISRRSFIKLSSGIASWMTLSGSSFGLLREIEKTSGK